MENHIQDTQHTPGSRGTAHAEERRKSAKRTVRDSELKRELKEIKKARQQLEVARTENRQDVATGDLLYGVAFVKPPALGAVQRQKRSWSGSRSSSVFRGARVKYHDPVASKLAVWAESVPGIIAVHTFQRMANPPSREGRRRDWKLMECPPVATCTKSCNPCTLPSVPGPFASSRPRTQHAEDQSRARHTMAARRLLSPVR